MYMPMNKTNKLANNEQGFASIVIALILIVVLSLLTVGFAQLARREQQNALSKQLATQAYYAAETGINDAIKAIPTIQADPLASPNTCVSAADLPNQIIGPVNNGVLYTCVLVNLTPLDLVKDPMSPDTGWTTTFSTAVVPGGAGSGILDSVSVNWSSLASKPPRPAGTPGFTPSTGGGSWNSPAVLQLSITPLAASQTSRNDLTNNTFTAYLYPSVSGSGTVTYALASSAGNAQIISANHCSSGTCSVTVSGLSASPGSAANEQYLVHIYDYYDTSSVAITGATDTSGGKLDFTNSQAQIDSTGKAKDVLKRIQAAVPLNTPTTLSNYATEAQNICKRFSTYPQSTTWDALDPSCALN